ncbi:MAG: chromosome segregation protein SMC [Acidobacteria bacterium]|nr:MAG: chromosome segregation protein SMC [Acidobacteriota bacterium]
MPPLEKVRVAGFKSIRDQEVELRPLNVMIGANGAGKSNFVGIFRLLREIIKNNLQLYVARSGGADRLLHFGRKATDAIELQFEFEPNLYRCRLEPTASGSLIFADETVFFHDKAHYENPYEQLLGRGHVETLLRSPSSRIATYVLASIESWWVYHFHDTSENAKVKQAGDVDDNRRLRPDAGNLAALLYLLRDTSPATYRDIVETVRLAAPFFDDFDLAPDRRNPRTIKLEWKERGSDAYFDASSLSDGTLRFISLATLLLQPQPPATILLDEPELGLHPYAITLLADLLRSAAERTQLIVSTQSVTLVNQLAPEDVIVVDREAGASVFRRLNEADVASWLDDYALGDLWEKNVIGGRPG